MQIRTRLWLLLSILTGSSTLAAGQSNGDPAGAACGVLGCGAFGLFYLIILALCMAVPITLIVIIVKFIRKDAISRGMPNADSIKWLGLLGLLGLLIYLLQRPDTVYYPCTNCAKPRTMAVACPHCGNA